MKRTIIIEYPDQPLLSLKQSPDEFEAEARLLIAVKLYKLGRVSTGIAAQIAGISRIAFIFTLEQFGVSAIGTEPDELE